jgi:hypothetical protein
VEAPCDGEQSPEWPPWREERWAGATIRWKLLRKLHAEARCGSPKPRRPLGPGRDAAGGPRAEHSPDAAPAVAIR